MPSEREKTPEDSSDDLPIIVRPAMAELIVQSSLETEALTFEKPVKFDVDVSNQGNIIASAVLLSVVLPPKVSFSFGDPTATTTSGNSFTWQLGDISPAASRTVTVTIALDASLATTVAEPTPQNVLKFKFDASSASTQANRANNHLEIDKHVERVGSDVKVWLSVQGADTPGELPVGKDVTYTITYGNFGNAPAQHASVSLSLWEGLNLVHAEPPAARTANSDRFAGGILSWDVGDLGIGQSNLIKSQIHVTSIPEDGSLVMATIFAPDPGVNSGENVAYSLRHAPIAAGHHGAAAQSGHLFRWVVVVLTCLAVLWAVFRSRQRPAQ
jgi:uncharacterized repeat protein (TIGR01451 family)